MADPVFDEIVLPEQDSSADFAEIIQPDDLTDHSPAWNQRRRDAAKEAEDAGLPSTLDSRQRLIDAIARTESAGFKTPHFIGLPDEPTGDRGVTRDIENLVSSLKQQEASATGPEKETIARQRAYWEKEAGEGMSAELWRSQTGESDPLYPHERLDSSATFDELILPHTSGQFEQIVLPKKPETETEAALAETPTVSKWTLSDLMSSRFTNEDERKTAWKEFRAAGGKVPQLSEVGVIPKEAVEGILRYTNPVGLVQTAIEAIAPDAVTTKIGAGAIEGVSETLSSFTTPENLAQLAIMPQSKIAQVMLNLGFGAEAIRHIPEQIQAYAATEDVQEKARIATSIAASLGLPAFGVAHALGRKTPVKPVESPEVPPATTDRPVEQTALPDNPAQRMVPIEEIPKGETDAVQIRSPESEIPRTVETGENQPGINRESRPGESVDTSEARPAEIPAVEPQTVAEIPENLRRSPEIDRLINEPDAQTGPQMKMAAPTEGGALGFGGGKRATVAPKGTTPRGDTEFLRIEPGYKRILKGLERKGATDVLGETKNKVGKLLSDATRKHVDIEQELFGRISTELIRPIKAVPKKVAAKAFDEVAGYLAAKENGRPLPTISPTAQNLVTAWENIADKTGKIAAANGVQVFDPALNASRPMHTIGRQYVPRMFKAEVEQVLRDPTSNPRLWNDLVTDFAAQRKIPEADAANQLTREAGKFSSNDFMGNLEMARSGKMPESFYEYDLRNIAARYIPNFSERMAQIISYGQRLGPRENPTRPDLWDIARKESRDPYTQDWLNSAENQAVNLKLKGTAATGMARAQTAASGLLLSSPTTTVMRNLISGMSATPELLGVRRSLKGFSDTIRKSQTRMDAKEIGTVRDNIADFLHADRLGDSPVDNAIRSVVDAGLKYSGYNGSEVFVRTHGTVTAAQFAKDAVAALAKKPTSMRSKEALGLFQRMGVDAAKIVAEKADWKTGPETRKFIRTVIRDTQGGYRFDQVPLWANSNMGRFFFQFGRWGTQRARNIWQNGIQPALGEEVQWHGKTMTRRDLRPLAKMLAGTVILGETFAGIAQVLFGRDRRDASLSEISAAWNEDEKKAVGLALQRVVNDVITAGTLGIWSQPIDWAKGLKDQSRLKNPMEPPGLGSLTAFKELAQDMIDQRGELTRRDLWKFTASLVPGVKQMGDVARNVMDEPLYEAENDVRTLRGAAHRWGDQSGLDVSPRNRGDFRKSALAPEYEPIKEALLVGDSQRAKFLASVFLDSQTDKDKARQNLKMSIKMSQPFRAGPYTAKVHRDNFREWARKNLNEDDYQQTERIQARYQKAAISANLW